MRIGKIALGLTITSSGLILSIPVHAGYVGNDPLNAVDPSGRVTCSNSDCSKATIDPNPTGQTTFAPPKAPQSTSIPSQQSPINSDTISFINDNPKNPSPNQPVTYDTAVAVETAVTDSGVSSININSTTGGHANSPRSRHNSGQAVDINKVNGQSIASQGASSAVTSLQQSLSTSGVARENFGPASNQRFNIQYSNVERTVQTVTTASIVNAHNDHIHFSTQSLPRAYPVSTYLPTPRIKPVQ